VSDHQALHVFDVTQILLGDDPGEGSRGAALPHYADMSVPVWFRVRDSRALSYDHGSTNDWFAGQLGPVLGGSTRANGEPFSYPFDPTAREQIASAWVTRGYLARDEDVDPTDGFNHVARAVEIELRDELLDAFERLVAARKLARLKDAIAEARATDPRGHCDASRGSPGWGVGAIAMAPRG
jgi:hypothetical protein